MCGRYAVTTDPARLAGELDAINEVSEADTAENFVSPNFNVAPTSTVLAVVDRHEHGHPEDNAARRVRALRWGLIPPWTKQLGGGPVLFNARAESLAEKPAFKRSLPGKRCLIPMDGWYEWRVDPAADTVRGKTAKTPFFIHPADNTRFFVAGLWSAWRPPQARAAGDDSAWVSSATIITTESVGELRTIHPRMPLVKPFEDWDAWLDPDSPPDPGLLAPPSAELVDRIVIRRVTTLVNRVTNNGPELIEPA